MNLTLQDYLDTLKNKRVAVVGIGVSNTPLIKLLRRADISVTACDKREESEFGALAEQLQEMGVTLSLGAGYLEGLNQDVIFRSPGIRPDIPPFVRAQEKGSVLTSEMEVFFSVCPCKIIAVTGSDGKTTTTTLISELLKGAGYTVHLGGNIGTPLLDRVPEMQTEDIAVLELSSFQLMTLSQSPALSVVTNLSPNHLDIHTSMNEYRQAKENVFLFQRPEDTVVFNFDNEETRAMIHRAPGKRCGFSRREILADGVFLKDDMICLGKDGAIKELFSTKEILIPGDHNIENYLAAICAVQDLVSMEVMQETARTFPGVAHRIELVDTVSGVRYYNDSIASSPTRTMAGLSSFEEKLILIAGGYDKKIPFEELGRAICRRVKIVILNGHTAEKIRDAIMAAPEYQEGAPQVILAADFSEAVYTARRIAQEGDVVLMSPACASFDQFQNFAARGDCFRDYVRSFGVGTKVLMAFSNIGGPSGFEQEAAQFAMRKLKEFFSDVFEDRFGNMVGLRRCGKPNAKRVLLDAHLDEIGLIVTGMKDGFLRFHAIGGVDPRILPNQQVTLLTQPTLPGVISTLPPHIQTANMQNHSTPIDELWIDIGYGQEETATRVPVGTPVVFSSTAQLLQGDRLAGKALDDKAGFLALLHAAELLRHEELDVDLYVMGSSREEVAGSGAAVGTFALEPDCCIAVDVTHGRTPDGQKEETFPLGKGPVIGIGPNMTRWMTQRLIEKAKDLSQDWEPEVMPGHSGTNAWRMQISREGLATAVLSIPLRYMHTPNEVIDYSDVEKVGELLAAFVKNLGQEGRWGSQ